MTWELSGHMWPSGSPVILVDTGWDLQRLGGVPVAMPSSRRGYGGFGGVRGQRQTLEQQGVDGDQQAGSGHGQRGDLWSQYEAEGRLKHASGDGQGDGVVADGPAEVLPHLAQGAAADP